MLKWIGTLKGVEGLANIPARDLTAEEAVTYGGAIWLLSTGLWSKPDVPKKDKVKDGSIHDA